MYILENMYILNNKVLFLQNLSIIEFIQTDGRAVLYVRLCSRSSEMKNKM